MPLRRLLVGVGDAETSGLCERLRDDLQARRQISRRETTRHGDRGEARQVERIGKIRTEILFIGVHAFEGFGRARRGWRRENIDAGEVGADLLVQYGSCALGGDVVRGAEKSAFEHSASYRAAELHRRGLKSLLVVGVGFAD